MSRSVSSRGVFRIAVFVLAILLLVVGLYLLLRAMSGALPPVGSPQAKPTTDRWEVAFTTPIIPDDPSRHRGGLDARLVALMNRSTRTLDVAVYDFDLINVAESMARAAQRGVRVRMVTDSETVDNTKDGDIQAAFRTVRNVGIPLVEDNRSPVMHHKFTVVDGEWLQTGSWNYTDGDTYRLNNNLAIFRSDELAENYTAEFEKMFVQRKFGPSKPKGTPHPIFELGGTRIESYFAPPDAVSARLIDQINRAQRKIHFLAFSFTHDGIGTAMIGKQNAGLEVQGVFETTGSNTSFSEYGRMKQAGLDVYQDGSPYVMHHKVILLDDRITIFGSYNFSQNADRDNDENLLIVDDPRFAAEFEQEFQRVLALAKNPPARK
jgi:phosphatidylserine/phosphatidylglycerophosphate/cardiolipin synthase-like enzyme